MASAEKDDSNDVEPQDEIDEKVGAWLALPKRVLLLGLRYELVFPFDRTDAALVE